MNFSSLREYLVRGLDPLIEESVNAPYMSTLDNWIPTPSGLVMAQKLTTAEDLSDLTGYGVAPFGDVKTYSDYTTIVSVGEDITTYLGNHARCCASKGMLFFAMPSEDFAADTMGALLYTPGEDTVFWCGAFNEGLGAVLGEDTDLHLMTGETGYDQLHKLSCGYIQMPGVVYGLHPLEAGVVVNTSDGIYVLQPADFDRFTFGKIRLATDVCYTPMSYTGHAPLLVNSVGEVLVLEQEGIKKLGYSRQLVGKTILRTTKHSYRQSFYICVDGDETFVINDLGMYRLIQRVHFKSDDLEAVESVASLGTAVAETVPTNLGIEGIKNIKGIVINCSSNVTVSIGYKKSRNAAMEYTNAVVASPDSRGVINEVVSGYEFTIKLTGAADSSSWVSDLGVLVTDATKTNFSRLSRRA